MFVASAEIERPVRNVIALPIATMKSAAARPTLPSIQPKRRYITTPMIVRMLGVKTPWNVPNPYPVEPLSCFAMMVAPNKSAKPHARIERRVREVGQEIHELIQQRAQHNHGAHNRHVRGVYRVYRHVPQPRYPEEGLEKK